MLEFCDKTDVGRSEGCDAIVRDGSGVEIELGVSSVAIIFFLSFFLPARTMEYHIKTEREFN